MVSGIAGTPSTMKAGSQMKFRLVRDASPEDEINSANIREFEDAIASDPEVEEVVWNPAMGRIVAGTRALWRRSPIAPRTGGSYDIRVGSEGGWKVAVLLGPSFRRCAGFITSGPKAAYLFDATPPWTTPEVIVKFATEAGIHQLFVDHPAFVTPIQEVPGAPEVHFVPQAIGRGVYRSAETRDIDVLEYGRKMPGYHEQLVAGLKAAKLKHEYGFIEGRGMFLDCLSRAKITTCFPRSLTEGLPPVPMLTMRYFQAMASKSLIVGTTPPLLRELFGYAPVIEADLDHPSAQIVDILKHYESYQPLIEKNHATVMAGHTYQHRWSEIKAILSRGR